MILQDMSELYPIVYEKVLKDLDKANEILGRMTYSLRNSHTSFVETDDIPELIKSCDQVRASYEKALKEIEKGIPDLDEDDLPNCPECGARVKVIDPDNPIAFSKFRILCLECGYSLDGEYFSVHDRTATNLARQNIMQTYTAKARREEKRRERA